MAHVATVHDSTLVVTFAVTTLMPIVVEIPRRVRVRAVALELVLGPQVLDWAKPVIAHRYGWGPGQRSTKTRRNVAGMHVRSDTGLVFWALNSAESSLRRSASRFVLRAASKAFIVGP